MASCAPRLYHGLALIARRTAGGHVETPGLEAGHRDHVGLVRDLRATHHRAGRGGGRRRGAGHRGGAGAWAPAGRGTRPSGLCSLRLCWSWCSSLWWWSSP